MNRSGPSLRRQIEVWGVLLVSGSVGGLLLCLLGIVLGTSPLGSGLRSILIFGLAVGLCVLIGLSSDRFSNVWILIYAGIYLLASLVAGYYTGLLVERPFRDLTTYPPELTVPVAEAPNLTTPGYKRFPNGRILTDRQGLYIDSGVDADGVYYEYRYVVAPVVLNSWQADEPITLWVVTGSQETAFIDFAEWVGPVQVLPTTRFANDYGRAVQDAVETHNLISDPNALLLRLYEQDVDELAARLRQQVRLVLIITGLLGLVPLVGKLIIR